jgi:hypothetical protein
MAQSQHSLHAAIHRTGKLQIPLFFITLSLEPLLGEVIVRPYQSPNKVILGQWQLVDSLTLLGKDLCGKQYADVQRLRSVLRLTLALDLALCPHQRI